MSEALARTRFSIARLGHRGDGVAEGPVFVPYALSGETVEAEVEGERGRLMAIVTPSPDRIEPFCPHFGICGGCAVQHLAEPAYRAWKRSLVVETLVRERIETDIRDLVDAHGTGRRRVKLHGRMGEVGFSEARSHNLIDLDACPILVPALNAALPVMRAIEKLMRGRGKPLDFAATATPAGIDLDMRGAGPVDSGLRLRLAELAQVHGLARLSNHGDVVVEPRAPLVRFGRAQVAPPPGAFLQATEAADIVLAGLVAEGVAGARRIADLFAGCGTFSLALAERAAIHAVDSERLAIAALEKAARHTAGLKPVTTAVRDLFHRPLLADELKSYDAVVFDPPRAGAEAQARRLSASKVRRIVGVSCNAATFARDAAILIAGGYRLDRVTPVDQFRHSAHVELVGVFMR